MRVCPRCEQSKDLDSFHLRKDTGKHRTICKECHYKQSSNGRKKNPEVQFYARIKHKYGLGKDDLQELYDKQVGLCGICLDALDKFAVDHDHATGKVRGLLCYPCNSGLSQFKDNTKNLRRAILWVEKEEPG